MKILVTLPLLLLAPTAAAAQAAEGGAPSRSLDISGGVTLLSDYRFRGISRSGDDPALQAELTVSLPNGLYAGGRGTSLNGLPSGADAQLDLYAGYTAAFGPATTLDVGIMSYAFPGGRGPSFYVEPYASLSHTLGPVEATVGAKYAPSQRAIGDEDSLYLFGEVEAGIPATPVTLTAQAGWQDSGAFGRYWNWSVGGRYAFGPVEAGLRYVDTDLTPIRGRRAGLVASLGFRF
jgi:uncharacterized protein (TIGR02001 family)